MGMKPSLKESRQRQILQRLGTRDVVSVAEMSAALDVSEMTLRRDLAELEDRRLIRRVWGGAVLAAGMDPGYRQRAQERLEEKVAVANVAAGLVTDGQTVFLDAGTTMAEVARAIVHRVQDERLRLRVVTNSMSVAAVVVGLQDLSVMMIGGEIDPLTISATGAEAVAELQSMNFDVCFLGVSGIHHKEGLTNVSRGGVAAKRTALSRARERWAVADSAKWGKISFYKIAEFADINGVISDGLPVQSELAELQTTGLTILSPG